jgi:antitoxin VapB
MMKWKEYRFAGKEVRIRRRGAAVILEPIPTDWSWLDELATGSLDDDFIDAVREPAVVQERPAVDRFFE